MKGNFLDVFRITSVFSVALPLSIYFLTFFLLKVKSITSVIHKIGLLTIVSATCDTIGTILYNKRQSNALVINIYFIVQFCLLSLLYYKVLLKKNDKVTLAASVTHAIIICLIIILLLRGAFINGASAYQSFIWSISGLIILIYGILYQRELHKARHTISLSKYGMAWINGGVILYFTISIWIFIFGNYIFTDLSKEGFRIIWSFHNVANIMKNILFAIGIYYEGKNIADHAKSYKPINP